MQNLILKEGLLGLGMLVGAAGMTQIYMQQQEGVILVVLSVCIFTLRGIGKKHGWF